MSRTYFKRQKRAPVEPATPQSVQRQLAWAAGSEYFRHRDPVWHVTEDFRTHFDRIGRQKAGERLEEPQPDQREARPEPAGQPELRQFSETAFQRGKLAGAVLQGTGRMMLTSCLKRTAGQGTQIAQERTLTGLGSKTRRIPGGGTSQVSFHRGFVQSAVGLTVDVLQDARRTVDLMTKIVQGRGGLGERDGIETLRTQYPFLDHSREDLLLEQYRKQLQQADGVQEKALLHSAILRTEALRNKKAQMKEAFTQKLREISDRANQALREFQEPDFVDRLMQDLTEGDGNASHGRPADGEPSDNPGAPNGGAGGVPPERPSESGGDAGPAGGAGGDGAGEAPSGAGPSDIR